MIDECKAKLTSLVGDPVGLDEGEVEGILLGAFEGILLGAFEGD